MRVIKHKEVLLGITGGIAAYKAAEIVRLLRKGGCSVTVVMTENAKKFITPLTFETLTGRKVYSDLFDPRPESTMEHIELSKKADLLLIAPATANIIGKAARGIADDLLSCLLMTVIKPVLIAPAMNINMYLNPVVQENIACLKKRGVRIIGPDKGELACGDEGSGRLTGLENIVDAVRTELGKSDQLTGKKVLVTAGPTREPIDPVRFISNPSSGKMGFALAAEAMRRGAEVTLISGPTEQEPLPGIKYFPITTADEMKEKVFESLTETNIVIMAAAIGDYQPIQYSKYKIKKDKNLLVLEFKKTVDILAEIGKQKGDRILIGFAAETEKLAENALKKLKEKNLDMIVANKIGNPESGFKSDFNKTVILNKDGNREELPLMSKINLAGRILDMLGPCFMPSLTTKRKLSRYNK